MRPLTFLKFLALILLALWVGAVTLQNHDLLASPFLVFGESRYLPLWALLILVFFAGFLPPSSALLLTRFRRWNEERRKRDGDLARSDLGGLLLEVREAQLSGRPDELRRAHERVLARRPDDLAVLIDAGAAARERGDAVRALELHERARRLSPRSAVPLVELAKDHLAERDSAAALGAYQEAVKLDAGGAVTAVRALRDMAVQRSDWPEALRWKKELDRRLLAAPDAARAGDAAVANGIELERAVQLATAGERKEAVALLEGVVRRDAKFLPAAVALAEVLAESGDDAKALDALRTGFARTGSAVFLQALEDHHIEREAPMRALEELKAIVAAAEHDVLPRFALGRLYDRLEMPDEALRVLTPLLSRVSRSATLHFKVARLLERRGRFREAVELYRTTIRSQGAAKGDFACGACRERLARWEPRCARCGQWNTIEADFEEMRTSPEDLGHATNLAWGSGGDAYDDTSPPVVHGDEEGE